MATNPIERTLDKVGNVIEDLFASNKQPTNVTSKGSSGQTCLEKIGMESRKVQLHRNEWRKDLQYTRQLVLAEYAIQTEFKVSSMEDEVPLEASNSEEKAQKETVKKTKEKKDKKKKQEMKDPNKPSSPVETT